MIFASHATLDNPRLEELFRKLGEHADLWIAENTINESSNIPIEISQALAKSSHLLICWSAAAARSAVVQDELAAFYMRNPESGRILHLRLDSTPILPLFAARKYAWFREGDSADDAVKTTLSWIQGSDKPLNGGLASGEATFALPTPEILHQFPLGPKVRSCPAITQMIKEFTELISEGPVAKAVIEEAQDLRRRADPNLPAGSILINMGFVPTIMGGVYPFWAAVFEQACLKGPRMLAALLLVQDDIFFTPEGKKARAELFTIMRQMNSSR